jgi:hypothetical protein
VSPPILNPIISGFLGTLTTRGFRLRVEDGRLRVHPFSELTPDDKLDLAGVRKDLLAWFTAADLELARIKALADTPTARALCEGKPGRANVLAIYAGEVPEGLRDRGDPALWQVADGIKKLLLRWSEEDAKGGAV